MNFIIRYKKLCYKFLYFFCFLLSNNLLASGDANVTISTSATSNGSWSGSTTMTFTPSANTANVKNSDITTYLNSGKNVTILTSCSGSGTEDGNITVSSSISNTNTTSKTLTFTAANNVTISSAITLNGSNASCCTNGYNADNLTITAGGAVSITAAISLKGGTSGTDSYSRTPGLGGAVIITGASVSTSSNGTITTTGGASGAGGAGRTGGAVSITSTSSTITIAKNITTTGGSTSGTAGGCTQGGTGGSITIDCYSTLTYTGATLSSKGGAVSNYYSKGGNGGSISLTYCSVSSGTLNSSAGTGGGGCASGSSGSQSTSVVCSSSPPSITTTNTVTSITCSSATSGGTTISDEGASITTKGVCWATSSSPTTSDFTTSDGSGTADFVSSLTGLSANTTYYVRAYATNSEGTSYGPEVSFTTLSSFTSGTISTTGETICYGGTPASTIGNSVSASGGDNSITYSWRSSADGYTAAISGATSSTYTPPAGLTSTTSYRRYAKDGTCNTTPTVSTGTWTVTVRDDFTSGTISTTGETICYGGTPASTIGNSVSASGGDNSITYSWRSSADSYTAAISGATSSTYTPPAGLTSTTSYRRYAQDGACESATVSTGTWTVTVRDDFSTGTISSDGETICSGGTPGVIGSTSAASGGDASISYTWRSSDDGYTAAIAGATSSTYTPPSGLTSTTSYRRYAADGTCNTTPTVSTGTWTVTVTALPTITGSNGGSRCNTGTVDIDATASAGSIEWYDASSGGSNVGSSASAATFTTPSISTTTTYYAEADNGGCTSAARTAVTATVNTASVGPGGVTDELHVWLKADAGVGSIGTSWEDQSCNGFDYTTVAGPSVESGWNYNPVIEILSGGFDAPAGAELGTDWTVFFVSALLASDNIGRLIDGHSGDYLLGYHGAYRNGIDINGSPSEYNSGIATTSGIEEPHVFTYVRESTGSTIDARVDGDLLKTFTSTNSGSGIRLDINQGANSSESTDSWIGEFIIYNKELSDAEIQKVEAYLGTKYAVALSNADGGTGGDYISTGGTTYWDASANSTHNTDIVVIGKDANTGLTQKQSKSQDDSLIVFISSLASDNASNAGTITNDESFITIGHNGGALLSNSSVNAERPAGIETRFAREWKLTNTNFDDNFSIEVEWDSTGAFDISQVRLLVDDDGDFSNASVYSSSDGITFNVGSIIVGGLSTTIFPKGFSKFFTLASANAATPLPVELQYFTATEYEDKVLLTWKTLAEINNDHFIIEKSSDGINWEEIIVMSGVGMSVTPTEYTAVDFDGCDGICYYRLTQVDFDGKKEVFKAIKFGANEGKALEITVSPNPVIDEADITFSVPEYGSYNFSIVSQTGQLIYQAQLLGTEDLNKYNYSANELPKGIYHFIISDNNGNMIQQKVLK